MDLRWYERSLADVPAHNEWLCHRELEHLAKLRFPRRHADWRLGRWTAKQGVAEYLNLPGDFACLSSVELRPEASGAPQVFIRDLPAGLSISLSHRTGIAACVLAPSNTLIGCDIERIEPRADVFVGDYFTVEERSAVERSGDDRRQELIALIWSAKESALKALRLGLRVDTRYVSVGLRPEDQIANDRPFGESSSIDFRSWNALRVRCENGSSFTGRWCARDDLVRTLVWNEVPAAASAARELL